MSYESVVLSDSPSIFWLFNETVTPDAIDSSGNGNGGVYQEGFTLEQPAPPGVTTFSVGLDGSTGYVWGESLGVYQSNISAVIWFKTPTTDGGPLMVYADSFNLYMSPDGTVRSGIYDTTENFTVAASSDSYNDNEWHYVGTSYDASSGDLVLCVDGSSVGSANNTNGINNTGLGDLLVGANSQYDYWDNGPNNAYYPGLLCAAAIFPSPLTASRFSAQYAASKPVVSSQGLMMASAFP